MVELVVLGVTGVALAIARGLDARRRRIARAALERFALRRGHRFAEGTTRAGPRVTARKGDVDLTIDYCVIRGELRTRVRAAATTGRAPRVTIVQRRAAGAFEELFRVEGIASADVPTLVADCAGPLATLARRASVSLASDGARVALTWRGIETEIELFDAAIDAVAAAAAWHAPRAPYR